MVRKQKSIAQLEREIALQRKRLGKEQALVLKIEQRNKLSRELFELKNQKLLEAGSKARRLSKRFGKGILRVGKIVVPIVKKQGRLIREQQLRDDAAARRVGRREPPKTKKRKTAKPKKRKKTKSRKKKSRGKRR